MPARMDEAIPVSQLVFKTSRTSSPSNSRLDSSAYAPVTTTTGLHPAPSAARAARLSKLSPRNRRVCLGLPMREDDPAASRTAPTLAVSLSTIPGMPSPISLRPSRYRHGLGLFLRQVNALVVTPTAVNRAAALAQHLAAPPRKHRAHLCDD